MFEWLWRNLDIRGQDASEYDEFYGLPKRAVAEWLQWNPQLLAEHQAQERLAQSRRDEMRSMHTIRAMALKYEVVPTLAFADCNQTSSGARSRFR